MFIICLCNYCVWLYSLVSIGLAIPCWMANRNEWSGPQEKHVAFQSQRRRHCQPWTQIMITIRLHLLEASLIVHCGSYHVVREVSDTAWSWFPKWSFVFLLLKGQFLRNFTQWTQCNKTRSKEVFYQKLCSFGDSPLLLFMRNSVPQGNGNFQTRLVCLAFRVKTWDLLFYV